MIDHGELFERLRVGIDAFVEVASIGLSIIDDREELKRDAELLHEELTETCGHCRELEDQVERLERDKDDLEYQLSQLISYPDDTPAGRLS